MVILYISLIKFSIVDQLITIVKTKNYLVLSLDKKHKIWFNPIEPSFQFES